MHCLHYLFDTINDDIVYYFVALTILSFIVINKLFTFFNLSIFYPLISLTINITEPTNSTC